VPSAGARRNEEDISASPPSATARMIFASLQEVREPSDGTSAKDMRVRSSCSAQTGPSRATSMATSDRPAKCSGFLGFDPCVTTPSGVTRSQAKRSPAGIPSRRCRRSSGIDPSKARTCTRTLDRVHNDVWSRCWRRSRHLMSTTRQRAIGIGAPRVLLGDPSHTTRHAGPHRAVRRVEVTRRAGARPARRSSGWGRPC
jgi:hypothetical protein